MYSAWWHLKPTHGSAGLELHSPAQHSGSQSLNSVQPEMHGALASSLVCKCPVRESLLPSVEI